MNARTEPTRLPQPISSEETTLAWLDVLAGDICTPQAFLEAMREQFEGRKDQEWEVLALLDQYYRRGRIKAEVFHAIKSRLEGAALDGEGSAKASPHPPNAVTAPAAATRTPPAAAATPAVETRTSPVTAASAAKVPPVSRPPAREVAVGDVLRKRYRVRAVVGHGGMGTVFEATDEYRVDLPAGGRRLAVKVLHSAIAQREDLLSELKREFQHLQLLSHPNIVRVHEFDRDDDVAFFTMELLSGALLSRVLQTRNAVALPRPYALAVIRDVGAALCHAHSRGVIHGDVNPQNIFITNEGELRVLDFGASHELIADRWSAHPRLPPRSPVATPGYASCQLLEGQPPDARDDLFALACVAYLLLSGQHPFPNRTAVEARAQRLRPRRPPGLTGQQWRMLREALRWERERRPRNVQGWLQRFDLSAAAPRLPSLPALVKTSPPKSRAPLRALAAAAILVLLAGGGYWAVMNHDSLARSFAQWRSQVRPVPSAPALPAAAAPSAHSGPSPAPTLPAAPTLPPAPTVPLARKVAAAAAPAAAATRAHAAASSGNVGPVRVELVADTVDVPNGVTVARVSVHRRGSLHGAATFKWWTESGTAKPGVDFDPILPGLARIEDGSGSINLDIPVSASRRSPPKSFYVVIDQSDSGAAVGPRALTMVTLQPPE